MGSDNTLDFLRMLAALASTSDIKRDLYVSLGKTISSEDKQAINSFSFALRQAKTKKRVGGLHVSINQRIAALSDAIELADKIPESYGLTAKCKEIMNQCRVALLGLLLCKTPEEIVCLMAKTNWKHESHRARTRPIKCVMRAACDKLTDMWYSSEVSV